MRRTAILFLAGLLLSSLLPLGSFVCKAEEGAEASSAFGEVVSVSSESVTVKEYDYELETEVEMTYEINASTVMENVEGIKDIEQADEISIDYTEEAGKKTAVNIYLYEE
ncbi:MAG: hypothetical protein ABH844_03645 [Candidatus Omnitrophota bacterium]